MNSAAISQVTDLSTILVEGDDATTFLQGQLTCDVTQLGSQWRYGALCNPQGRALALFYVWELQNGSQISAQTSSEGTKRYCLTLPTELVATIKQRLQMYVLRSKVKLSVLDELFYYTAETEQDDTQDDHNLISSEQESRLLFADHALLISNEVISNEAISIEALSATEKSDDDEHNDSWLAQQIKAGHPQIVNATSGEFIPQMLNLDLLGGISMTKGCYTGQEIIARMHYLGNLKQRMYLLSSDADTASPPPNPGVDIFLFETPDKKAGRIVCAANGEDKQYCLAVLRINNTEENTTFAIDGQAWQLDLSQQPYSLS